TNQRKVFKVPSSAINGGLPGNLAPPGHARLQQSEFRDAAAVERERLDLRAVNYSVYFRVDRVHHTLSLPACDRHGLADASYGQYQSHGCGQTDLDLDAFHDDLLEAGQLSAHAIVSERYLGKDVQSCVIGNRSPRDIGIDVRQSDCDSRNAGPGLINDLAVHPRRKVLRRGGK